MTKLPYRRASPPTMRGALVMKLWRGLVVVQKWPRKRGKSIDPGTRTRSKQFGDACRLSNQVAPSQMEIARKAAKASLMVPRDLIISAMYGNLFDLELEDGRIITKRQERLYDTVFQGFTLQLATDFTFATGSWEAPNWPLPIRDTAGFWSVAAPDLITIPSGVTMIQFFGGAWAVTVLPDDFSATRIFKNGSTVIASAANHTQVVNKSLVSAPLPVVAGDTFQLQYFQSSGFNILAGPPSFFAGLVLETA